MVDVEQDQGQGGVFPNGPAPFPAQARSQAAAVGQAGQFVGQGQADQLCLLAGDHLALVQVAQPLGEQKPRADQGQHGHGRQVDGVGDIDRRADVRDKDAHHEDQGRSGNGQGAAQGIEPDQRHQAEDRHVKQAHGGVVGIQRQDQAHDHEHVDRDHTGFDRARRDVGRARPDSVRAGPGRPGPGRSRQAGAG
jgi:hypothetical protein